MKFLYCRKIEVNTSNICANGKYMECIVWWQRSFAQRNDDSITRCAEISASTQADIGLQ